MWLRPLQIIKSAYQLRSRHSVMIVQETDVLAVEGGKAV